MSTIYYIDHIREDSINLGDRIRTEVRGTYQQAVNKAHEIWGNMTHKTGVAVHSNEHCIYYWHKIDASGEVCERNTNSGVTYQDGYSTKYERGQGYVAA